MTEGREDRSGRRATERADEWLDRTGHTVGMYASLVGIRLARIAAFAREEMEDMWAEAQSMRQSMRNGGAGGVVEKVVETGKGAKEKVAETGEVATEKATESGESAQPPQATGSARKWAEKLGVDLQTVKGSGMDGQITVEDVRKKHREEREE